MEENLPEVQGDQPIAASPEGKRELVVNGNEVYLPDSERFQPCDAKFAAIVAEVLPDYAASLSEEALRRPRHYSAWAILLILLFFCSLIYGIFFLRPVVRLETTTLKVPRPEADSYAGEFSRQYREAMESVKAQRYDDAHKSLTKVVDQLLKRGEAGPKNEPIFYSYFSLFEHLAWTPEAEEQLKKLIAQDDQYRWKLFDIHRRLWKIDSEKLDRLPRHVTVDSLYADMARIDELRRLLHNDQKLMKQLDL